MTVNNMGVPLTYTDEIGEEICLKVSTSGKGVQRLCKENPHWPCYQTIYEWRIKVPIFGEMYAKAKRNQVELIIDQCLDIADDSGFDAIINEHGKAICNSEAINRARLRVDTRKWLAAKLEPRVYGDKTELKGDINLNDTTPKMNEHKKAYERDREY